MFGRSGCSCQLLGRYHLGMQPGTLPIAGSGLGYTSNTESRICRSGTRACILHRPSLGCLGRILQRTQPSTNFIGSCTTAVCKTCSRIYSSRFRKKLGKLYILHCSRIGSLGIHSNSLIATTIVLSHIRDTVYRQSNADSPACKARNCLNYRRGQHCTAQRKSHIHAGMVVGR